MKKVAVYGKYLSQKDKEEMLELIEILVKHTQTIYLEESIYIEFIKSNATFSEIICFSKSEDLKNNCDLFLSLGGDGTLLNAAMFVLGLDIPILGINTGRLGFLAGFQHDYFFQNIKNILEGDYSISERALLQLNSPNSTDLQYNYALNEVTILRKETISLISIHVYIDDQFLNTFWADGLIISTPTGSTGYSLSCGGPIVSAENDCFIITPVAPHNLNLRPIVILNKSKIRLVVESRASEYNLSLDSRVASFPILEEIELQLAPFKINLVHNSSYSYSETLRRKLFWGRDSRE